jgi:hypothetical protein
MFVEDLSVFFDVGGGFAVDALRTPAGGSVEATAKAVIFDHDGLNVEEFGVVTEAPAFVVPSSTWPTLAEADQFLIGGANYKARQVYPHRDGALTVTELAKLP